MTDQELDQMAEEYSRDQEFAAREWREKAARRLVPITRTGGRVGSAADGDNCGVCDGFTSNVGGSIMGATIGHLCHRCEDWARDMIGKLYR